MFAESGRTARMKNGNPIDTERVAVAKRNVIVCFSWLAVAPFALWFAIANIYDIWLSAAPLVFGCLAAVPLLFSYAVLAEYKDARNGFDDF